MSFPVKELVLQGDLDAAHYTILNLDLTGLDLTKASVGLGNVDNTSDALKPISTPVGIALALKEDAITAGTTSQFWRGDKTFVNYGSLALEDGNTTLPLLGVRGAAATSNSSLKANRHEYGAFVELSQLGESVIGNILTGLPAANVGLLSFEQDAYAVIRTVGAGSTPIIFGTGGLRRMRLAQGLGVGTDVDPGAGCISANGTISAAQLVGAGSGITGLVKNQIPSVLNSVTCPNLRISGAGGQGYITLDAQNAPITGAAPKIYVTPQGRFALYKSGTTASKSIVLDGNLLTADQIFFFPDVGGTIVVGSNDNGWERWTGTGDKGTKDADTASTGEVAAAVKGIIDVLFNYGMLGT